MCISIRWVILKKISDSKITKKARLFDRGFEETQEEFQTDSPCCSRIRIGAALAVLTTISGHLKSTDIQTAFFPGKKASKHKEVSKPKVWKLQKCVYGLADANGHSYLRVKEELLKLSARVSCTYPRIFYWKENKELVDKLIYHNDNIAYGRTTKFKASIIKNLKQIFKLHSEDSESFTNIGIKVKLTEDFSIIISQNSYVNSITEITLN